MMDAGAHPCNVCRVGCDVCYRASPGDGPPLRLSHYPRQTLQRAKHFTADMCQYGTEAHSYEVVPPIRVIGVRQQFDQQFRKVGL